MTTHFEQGEIRSAGSPFANLSAVIRAKFKAWREQRVERAQIEALEALGPEVLDDIGVRIVNAEKPANFVPVLNPYAIVVAALFAQGPTKRDEF
jgi:uncharacterized protein YjiS (DUF1127 family)